jgi:flagellar basal-body rod modification protein FlgD
MSISTPGIGTNTSGQVEQGTNGSSIGNDSSTTLSTNQFLDLMMDELQNQDPLNPSSSDPTQYLTELAQMTSVEQETNTAQNTGDTAQAQSVSQAVGLIGDSVTYIDQTTGASTTGTVNSVQITNNGPTLTVDGLTGVALSTITNVTAASAAGTGSTPTDTSSPAETSATDTSSPADRSSPADMSSAESGS